VWLVNNARLGTAANGANICTNPGSDLMNLAYAYGTTNNNGNLVSQTIARPGQTWTGRQNPGTTGRQNPGTAKPGDGKTRGQERVKKLANISAKKCVNARTLEE